MRSRWSRFAALAVTLISTVALAAPRQQSTGSACCTLLFAGLFVYIYRAGGADWLRAIGATAFPGIFGWFIWRDRELGTGSRWVSLIMASLHAFSFLLGLLLVLLIKGGAFNRFLPQDVLSRPFVAEAPQEAPVDLTGVPEDLTLGLHPLATITTDPPGATVFVNGQKRGTSPLDTELSAGQRNEVKVQLDGYFPASQERSPNARERLTLRFTLAAAARLQVTTTPPGARVLAGMKEVLARTPGPSAPLEAGETEVLVLLAGYQPHRQAMTLPTGDTPLEVTLTPGVKIAVSSTPDAADLFVDGQWVGLTPADVYVSPRKHILEVKKESWATARRVFAAVTRPTTFEVKLVDTDRVRAQQATVKARARYDQLNLALEKMQTKVEQTEHPTEKMERQLVALEREMEKAAATLERTEAQLKAIEDARGAGQPLPTTDPQE